MNIETAEAFSSAMINFDEHQQNIKKEITDRPKRPLNAYNYFFQNERKLMLGPDFVEKKEGRRIHRKTHGKFSFGEMAKIISKKWKLLDETTRSTFEQQAERDRQRYRQQMAMWKSGANLQKDPQRQEGKTKFQQPVTQDSTREKKSNNGSKSFTIDATTSGELSEISNTRRNVEPPILQAAEQQRKANIQSDETTTELLLPKSKATSLTSFFNDPHHLTGRNDGSPYVATVSAMSSDSNFSTCGNARAALTALRLQKFQQEKRRRDLSKELWRTRSILGNIAGTPSQKPISTYLGNGNLARLSHIISTTETNGLVNSDKKLSLSELQWQLRSPYTSFHPLLGALLLPVKATVNGGLLGHTKTV